MKKNLAIAIFNLLNLYPAFGQAVNWQWTRGCGYGESQEGFAVTTDRNGNVYYTGTFFGPSARFGSITLANGGEWNIFIAKYSSQGNLLWATCPFTSDSGAIMQSEEVGAWRGSNSIATDAVGNIYVTGAYFGGIVSFGGTVLPRVRQNKDAFFVAKYDTAGNPVWLKTGSSPHLIADMGTGVATDKSGNVFVVGSQFSDSLDLGGVVLRTNGGVKVFLAKYDSAGNVLWAKNSSGPASNGTFSSGVAVDGAGNAYITGSINQGAMFDSIGLNIYYRSWPNNFFITKYSPSGGVLWAVTDTEAVTSYGGGIATDPSGNVYVTGVIQADSVKFGSVSLQLTDPLGVNDFFVAKYDSLGRCIWGKAGAVASYSGGFMGAMGYAIAVDKNADVYISGGFDSIVALDSVVLVSQPEGKDPMYVFSLDSSGKIRYATQLSSGGDDQNGVAADAAGNVYICGDFAMNPFVVGPDTLQSAGQETAFLAKIGPTRCHPGSSLNYQLSKEVICLGDSALLTFSGDSVVRIWPKQRVAWLDSVHAAIFPDSTTTFSISGYLTCGAYSAEEITITVIGGKVTISASKNAICAGDTAQLCATAGYNTYLWNTGSTALCINALTQQNYTVTITDSNNCRTVSSPVVLTVYPVPNASITANGPISFCSGSAVTLTAYGNSLYAWNNSATTRAITATSGGAYTVTVTDANTCTNTSTTFITVNPLPDSTVTANKPMPVCYGDTVILTGAAALNYYWSNGATTQSINVSTNSTINLTVTNQYNCSAVSAPLQATLSKNDTAVITPSGPTSFCTGDSVTLTTYSGAAYSWSNGSTSRSITVSSGNSYTVSITVSGNCTVVSNPQVIVVYQNPGTPTITTGGPTIFCQGHNLLLSAPAGFTYLWSDNETVQQLMINTSGSYALTVTDGNGCSASSTAIMVTVNPLPVVSLALADTLACNNIFAFALTGGIPVGGVYSGTAVSGNDFSPAIADLGSNLITYTYTDSNNCLNSADQNITVRNCLGLDNISLQQIICLPNPSNGNFEVDWTGVTNRVTDISIYDLEGELIYTCRTGVAQKQSMSLQNAASAIYFLMLKTEQGSLFKKLVIER